MSYWKGLLTGAVWTWLLMSDTPWQAYVAAGVSTAMLAGFVAFVRRADREASNR